MIGMISSLVLVCVGVVSTAYEIPFNPNGQRIWTVAHGHDWGPHEYFDEKGYIQGFTGELIDTVCKAAGMDCRKVWAPYTQCWDSAPGEHPYGGPALMDGWVDACTGWGISIERIHVFDFSMPYINVIPIYFWVRAGQTGSFDITNLDGKKIGFLDGYAYDEKCLARKDNGNDRRNYILPKERVFYASSPEFVVPLLLNGTVDAILGSFYDYKQYMDQGKIEVIQADPFECTLQGNGMMTRKESEFNSLWNKGFSKIRASGGFMKLCEDANKNHGVYGQLDCSN